MTPAGVAVTVVVVVAILGPVGLVLLFSLFARLGSWATPAAPGTPLSGRAIRAGAPVIANIVRRLSPLIFPPIDIGHPTGPSLGP